MIFSARRMCRLHNLRPAGNVMNGPSFTYLSMGATRESKTSEIYESRTETFETLPDGVSQV